METKQTTDTILCKGDVLSPKMVLELELLPGATLGWLYRHWEEIGGVTRGNKKFILKENLYANLKGEQQSVLCESIAGQGVVHTCQGGNESIKLGDKNRSKSSGGGTAKVNQCTVVDHSNDFGLVNLVQ